MLLGYRSTKHAKAQATPTMLLFNRDIRNYFVLLNKTKNRSHQEKEKQRSNSKIKSKTRFDKTMNVKISHIKVGDEILVKQRKRNKLTTLYKSEPFTVTEKKGNTVKMRDTYGKEWVRNVVDISCFRGRSDSLNKVPKRAGQDEASAGFINETSFCGVKESRQVQDQGLRRSARQRVLF